MENPELIALGGAVVTGLSGAVVGAARWIGGVFTRMQDDHNKIVRQIMDESVQSRKDHGSALIEVGDALDRLGEKIAEARDDDRKMIVELARRTPSCPALAEMTAMAAGKPESET